MSMMRCWMCMELKWNESIDCAMRCHPRKCVQSLRPHTSTKTGISIEQRMAGVGDCRQSFAHTSYSCGAICSMLHFIVHNIGTHIQLGSSNSVLTWTVNNVGVSSIHAPFGTNPTQIRAAYVNGDRPGGYDDFVSTPSNSHLYREIEIFHVAEDRHFERYIYKSSLNYSIIPSSIIQIAIYSEHCAGVASVFFAQWVIRDKP